MACNDESPPEMHVDKPPVEDHFGHPSMFDGVHVPSPTMVALCKGCYWSVKPSEGYACSTCVLWPLCGKCVLKSHLDDCRSFKVMKVFADRCEAYRVWFTDNGGAFQYGSIKRMATRMRVLVTYCRRMLRALPYHQDHVFCGLIENNYIRLVLDHLKQHVLAVRQVHQVRGAVNYMNRFVQGQEPHDPGMISIMFNETGPDELEFIVDLLKRLSSADNKTDVEAALDKLDKLAILLQASYRAQKQAAQPEYDLQEDLPNGISSDDDH